MKIRKEIDSGTLLPKWYGFAWRDIMRGVIVCYPIGINYIVSFIRWFYWQVARPPFRYNYKSAFYELHEENQQLRLDNQKLNRLLDEYERS